MSHMLAGENVGLSATRLNRQVSNNYFFCTERVTDIHVLDNAQDSTSLFPLYLYPFDKNSPRTPAGLFDQDQLTQPSGRQENISSAFRQALHQHYHKHYSPEEILGYIYAVLHSPTYRHRYKGFLKSDFPRIPLVKTPDIFEELSTLGWQLVQAHLMREIPNHPKITLSPGDYLVEKPLYQAEKQRLYINKTLYVEAVSPEVWNFHIGGYQVLDKYLKSRLGRTLNLDEITNIENIIKVLNFTLQQMQKIEALSAI